MKRLGKFLRKLSKTITLAYKAVHRRTRVIAQTFKGGKGDLVHGGYR